MAVQNVPLPNLPLTVWVCPAVGLNADGSTAGVNPDGTPQIPVSYYFPFSSPAAWRQEPALIPDMSDELNSSMGMATFKLLRQTRMETSDNQYTTYPGIIIGSWVLVMAGPGQPTFGAPSNVLWKGWIMRIDGEEVAGTTEITGSVTAGELGTILDRQQIVGWRRSDGKGGATGFDGLDPIPMDNPPAANMGSPTGTIIGNAYQLLSGQWVFARLSTEFGYAVPSSNGYTGDDLFKYWTRWKLLDSITDFCVPTALCPGGMNLICIDGSGSVEDPTDITTISGYLNQEQFPEVTELAQLTWRGALDILVPRERGLGWTVQPTDAGVWNIFIYTLAADGSYGVPAVPGPNQVPAPLGNFRTVSIEITQDASDLPDKVLMEGNPHVFCFTVAYADLNLGVGWNPALNPLYFAAASTINATIYATLTVEQQTDLNRQYRAQGWLNDVFTRFALLTDANGDLRLSNVPGIGATNSYPACPQLKWDATAGLTIDPALTSRMPYLGGVGLLRTLPLQIGFNAALVDKRAPQQKASPTYMPLRVFYYDSDDVLPWRDLALSNPFYGNIRPQIEPAERGAALHIEYSPRELLAFGVWPTDGSAATADIDPASDINGMDYTKLVATIAVESDQRVRVVAYRPGLKSTDDSQVRRTLRIFNPNLCLHAIWSGTIIGITIPPTGSTGTPIPDRINDSNVTPITAGKPDGLSFLRNDYGRASLLCQQAAGWAFRPRRAVRITLMQPSMLPADEPWVAIGNLLTQAAESTTVESIIGTVIERITRTYGRSPRVEVQTTLPPMPGFASAGSVSPGPSGGGPTSASLGGTPTQAIQAMREDLIDLQQKTVKIPIVSQIPLPPFPLLRVKISGGQIVNGISVIQYAADPFTADKAYKPATDTSYIVGLGYGTLYNTNGQPTDMVIIRHNYTQFTGSLIAGMAYTVGQPVQIPVSGGGNILVYPIIDG